VKDLQAVPHDFVAVLGDVAQNDAKWYADYQRNFVEPCPKPVYSLAGNGDLGAGLDAWRAATGLPLYYAIERRGIRFLFTSTVTMSGKDRHICGLGPEQLAWLEKELDRAPDQTTIIFSHAPLFETTWHSEDREQEPFPGSMSLEESAEVRRLLAAHSNVKVFAHGHLHHAWGATDKHGRGAYHREGELLHVSVGATANGQGSAFLYISRDRIEVRVRDHAAGQWRDEHGYTHNVVTTLAGE